MKSYDAEVQFATRDNVLTIIGRCMLVLVLSIVCPAAANAGVPQQIAPNPNLSSFPPLTPKSGDFNTVVFENFGTINVTDVNIFNRGGGQFANLLGVLTILSTPGQSAALINTDPGTNLYNFSGGSPINGGTLTIVGLGSQLVNQNGAMLQNGVALIANDPATLLSNRNGATLTNTGTGTLLVNQSGATLLSTGLSTLVNQNGAVLVNAFSGSQLINQGGSTLTNTDIDSVLVNDFGGTLTNAGSGTQLRNQNGAKLYNQNGATLINSASILNDSQIFNFAGAKFVVAPGGSVAGIGTYTQLDVGSVTNVIASGSMTQSSVTINGGTLGGGGTINSSTLPTLGTGVSVNTGAIVNPGLTPTDPNTLTINGTFTLDNATLKINIAGTGAGQFDRLAINGTAFFTGIDKIIFDFIGGFAPNAGDMFEFMTASNFDLSGLLAPFNISYTGLAPGFQYTNVFDPVANSFSLRADSTGVPAIPEPGTLSLMGLGLAGASIMIWRKRKATKSA